jgi:hypothetical protein
VGTLFPIIVGNVGLSFSRGRPLNMRLVCSVETSEIGYQMRRLHTIQVPMSQTGSLAMCRIIDNK